MLDKKKRLTANELVMRRGVHYFEQECLVSRLIFHHCVNRARFSKKSAEIE